MKILILNGSPSGKTGNSGLLVIKMKALRKDLQFEAVHLVQKPYTSSFKKKVREADAVIFVTGTYWDSWGSPLQKFLEDATELEADAALVGKPAGVVVLMHSVGGKGVLSRLQGVLSTFGFLIPPFTGIALSLAGQLAQKKKSAHADDFWCVDDLEVMLENLVLAAKLKTKWKAWPVDQKNFKKTWLETEFRK